jgi:hypothetical protein
VVEEHIAEALRLFDGIATADSFDLQCHYLIGKYYQEEKDTRKAYKVYLYSIKRFNQDAIKDPAMRSENTELAYSVALNLMTLQSNPVDAEVEVCFKIIRKSFPLHLKRIEYENEMAKPAPDKFRIKQLGDEIRKLRAEEEKTLVTPAKEEKEASATAPAEKKVVTPEPKEHKPREQKGIFSKLFHELSPDSVGLTQQQSAKAEATQEEAETFKFAPPQEALQHASAFMVYHNNTWEGPFSYLQLKTMGFLEPSTWVCRVGSQQVIQAYEMPDLQSIFKQQV